MTRSVVSRWFARRLILLAALVALASICATLAKLHWFFDLFSHFAPHYAVSALGIALALAAVRRWRPALFALALAAWNIVVVAHGAALFERPEPRAGSLRFTVFHFNGAYRNPDPDAVVDRVLEQADKIDVVVLIEATSRWQRALQRLQARFPHVVQDLDDGPFGIAVLSKAPADAAAIVDAPDGYRHAELRLTPRGAARPVAIYAIHPPPPVSAHLASARNGKLAHIAREIRARSGESAIVVGDFNLTPYSPHFEAFVRDSGLRPVQSHAILRNTWPVVFGQVWFGIPIDHSFIGSGVSALAHEIGEALGSDHLPVTLSIALP